MTDLTITQGDEKAYNLAFKSGNTPLDITGATLVMTVKRSLSDDAVITKTVTAHTDAEAGETTVTLSPTDTDLPLGKYFYDMQISGGTVSKKTVLKGTLEIVWQVTED